MQKTAAAVHEMLALEELSYRRTAVHRLHPLAKMLVTVAYVAVVVSVPRLDFAMLSLYFFYPAVLIALSQTPVRAIFKRVLIALPFVLFACISNLFFEPQTCLIVFGLPVSRGTVSLAVLIEKTLLTVSALLLYMATTRLTDTVSCLRRLHVPKIMVAVLMLLIRYLSLITGEADRMARAYRLRSAGLKAIRMKDMGSFLGQLLLRSVGRAERVYQAMKLRGFDGQLSMGAVPRMDSKSITFAIAACALILFFRFCTVYDVIRLFH